MPKHFHLIISANNGSRHLKCASHPDNTSIKWPKVESSTLHSQIRLAVGRSEERLLDVYSEQDMGSQETTYFSCSTIRKVTPFCHGWYWFVSVLSKVYSQDVLYFQSFMDGLTFGTNRFESTGLSAAGKRTKSHAASIEGSTMKVGGDST